MFSIVILTGLAFVVQPIRADTKTWIVDDDGPADFHTIQEAITAASPGDIIYVKTGAYNENIDVDKQLSLVGDGAEDTILSAANSDKNAINITANNVSISGFKITGATGWYPSASGVYLNHVNNVSLLHNYVTNNTYGICLDFSNNNTIKNNTVLLNYFGINLEHENRYNTIIENNASSNTVYGIVIWADSSNNLVANNVVLDNDPGISLGYSDFNVIAYNDLAGNSRGIEIQQISNNNTIFHNNIVDNNDQVYSISGAANFWDNGAEGNYWSNYTGVDSEPDGIGDTPHIIDANNTDNYPLMGMFSVFEVTPEHSIQTICNSTISGFQFNGTAISFNVSGEDGTTGFCRICIPTVLIPNEPDTYHVFVNGTEVPHTLLLFSNSTHSYLYFTYEQTTKEVVIIPEFPSMLILPFLIIFTFVVVLRKPKTRR